MIELLVMLAFGALVLTLLGVFAAGAVLIGWILVFPFKLLGFLIKSAAMVLMLPFLALVAIAGLTVFGAGLLLFLLPASPVIFLVVLLWWLLARPRPRPLRT